MDCADVDELLPGVALGVASALEERDVQEHLAGCDKHPPLEEFRRVAELLPMSVPPMSPPAEVKHRLMAKVYRDLEPHPITRLVRRPALGWLAAAALFLVSLGLGVRDWMASSQLAAAPVQWQLAPTAAGVNASGTLLFVRRTGTATLVLTQLPALGAGKVYEAWLIKGGSAVPAGIFQPASDGSASLILKGEPSRYDTVAVTEEPGPQGSAIPTAKPFVSGSLT